METNTTNADDIKVLLLIVQILATALLSAFFSYYFSSRKFKNEKKYEAKKESLTKLYLPIYKELLVCCSPDSGYEGLHPGSVSAIIKICEENHILVDKQLDRFYNRFIEDMFFSDVYGHRPEFNTYDLNSEFADFVFKKYKKLRMDTGFYNNDNFYFSNKWDRIFLILFRNVIAKHHLFALKFHGSLRGGKQAAAFLPLAGLSKLPYWHSQNSYSIFCV